MRSAIGCAALGLLLLLVAGTFDAEPLYVTGAALLLLGAGAAAWIGLGAWGASVQRTVGKRSVVEEEPLPVRIEATRGRLPLPPGWIDEPLLPEPVRLTAGRARARVRVEVTFGRRGRRVLAPPALVLRDPFGLAQRVIAGGARRRGAGAAARPARCARPPAAATASPRTPARRSSPRPRPRSTACASTARARPPRASTGRRVARGAGMMERKLISEADSRPLVVLDPRAPRSQDALDAAVRAAASLTVHFARKTGCGLLLPGDRRATRRARPAGLAAGARAAGADRRAHRARRSPPRRTAAGSWSSSPRASSTARRAGSAGRPAAA